MVMLLDSPLSIFFFKHHKILVQLLLRFKVNVFEKASKIDEIFTIDLTVTTYCPIDGKDFVNFCGLLRKRELYKNSFRMGTFGI